MSKAVHIPFRDAADAYWHLFVSTAGVARLTQDGTYTDSSGSAIGSGATVTLDQAYDNGATINGAIAGGSAIKLGGAGASDNISLYHDATNMYIACNTGDLKFSAAGGDFTFDNDNITTTGTIQGGTVTDGTFTTTAGAATGATYNGLSVTCAANAIALVNGTANVTLAAAGKLDVAAAGNVDFGTGTYNFVGNIDIATGKAVNIDNDVTIQGDVSITSALTVSGTTLANQDLRTAASPTFVGLTVSGAIATATTIGASGLVTAAGGFAVSADNVNITLGGSGATDSRIYFDGNNLCLYDSIGGPYTLQQLATGTTLNPTVIGDLTVLDGKWNWTNAADEIAGAWTFNSIGSGSDIDVVTATDSGECIHIVANSLTTGKVLDVVTTNVGAAGALVYLQVTAAGHNATGNFIECHNAAADVFEVGLYGAVTILGNASTDIITVTAGDVQITAGDIDLDLGIITVDNTADEGSYIKRNHASSTTAVFEIEQTNATNAAIGPCLTLDQNSTGNSIALKIEHDGDYAAIDISAGAARTGDAITIATANFLANRAIGISGASTGTSGQGIVEVATTGALAGNLIRLTSATGAPAATSAVAYLSSTGNIAAAIDGAILQIVESGAAQATTYAVNINSTSNEAMHVTAGQTLFSEAVSIATANSINQDTLTVTQNDTANDKDGIVCAVTGDGYVFKGTVNTATGKGLAMFGATSQTTSVVTVDGTTANWIGAENVGMVHITGDGALAHVGTSLVRITQAGTVQASSQGFALKVVDTAAASADSYAVGITSTANNSLYLECTDVTKNALDVTGCASFGGGVYTFNPGITLDVDTTDVTALAPLDAEIDGSGFGTAAAAGAGFMGVIDDANGHATMFIVISDGTTWHWIKGTKAL